MKMELLNSTTAIGDKLSTQLPTRNIFIHMNKSLGRTTFKEPEKMWLIEK